MLSPRLYKSTGIYDFFIKSLGYERSIDRFLSELAVEIKGPLRILDSGCGTGLMGLHFLSRFPEAQLVATDLEPNCLRTTLSNARSRKLAWDRIQTGIADISHPSRLTLPDGSVTQLQRSSFHLICLGAVVGYANCTESSIRELISLLAPGGILINLEMNESPSGKFFSRQYHYSNIALSQMKQIFQDEGCEVTLRRFRFRHLPAKLTRVAVIAQRSADAAQISS
jgi:ubiquinone/menaquinone biosynthesis C-methylase UbiE